MASKAWLGKLNTRVFDEDPSLKSLDGLETGPEVAIKALRQRDPVGLVYSVPRPGMALALVFDNRLLLSQRGMLPRSLVLALTGLSSNHHDWATSVVLFMLEFCKQECGLDALRSAGSPLEDHGNPDTAFRVYRGVSGVGRARKVRGLSWTGSLDIACWFALRFKLHDPSVYWADVRAKEVFCYVNDRSEQEFLVLPRHCRRLKISVEEMRTRSARHSPNTKQGA